MTDESWIDEEAGDRACEREAEARRRRSPTELADELRRCGFGEREIFRVIARYIEDSRLFPEPEPGP